MKSLHLVSFILVVVGAINWGLVALNESYNVVNLILGSFPGLERLVYALVGLAGLYLLFTHKKDCMVCGSKGSNM